MNSVRTVCLVALLVAAVTCQGGATGSGWQQRVSSWAQPGGLLDTWSAPGGLFDRIATDYSSWRQRRGRAPSGFNLRKSLRNGFSGRNLARISGAANTYAGQYA